MLDLKTLGNQGLPQPNECHFSEYAGPRGVCIKWRVQKKISYNRL
jgi:hypothetical protein